MDLSASLPTAFMSSVCPAIPITSVLKINGTMMHLINRMNKSDKIPVWLAAAGNCQPKRIPAIIARTIHWLRDRRRNKPIIMILEVGSRIIVFQYHCGARAIRRVTNRKWLRGSAELQLELQLCAAQFLHRAELEPCAPPRLSKHETQL